MDSISKENAIKILYQKGCTFFTVNDARKIFETSKDNTLYKLLQRLEKSEIIKRVSKGKYHFVFKDKNEFELANFLVNPSYISLESALNFYGILPQFPYTITSITTLKTRRIIVQEKEYLFSHIDLNYYWGFVKRDKFLIATPEKALLDALYFMSKKICSLHLDELDLKRINKRRFLSLSKQINFLPLQNLIKRIL